MNEKVISWQACESVLWWRLDDGGSAVGLQDAKTLLWTRTRNLETRPTPRRVYHLSDDDNTLSISTVYL